MLAPAAISAATVMHIEGCPLGSPLLISHASNWLMCRRHAGAPARSISLASRQHCTAAHPRRMCMPGSDYI